MSKNFEDGKDGRHRGTLKQIVTDRLKYFRGVWSETYRDIYRHCMLHFLKLQCCHLDPWQKKTRIT